MLRLFCFSGNSAAGNPAGRISFIIRGKADEGENKQKKALEAVLENGKTTASGMEEDKKGPCCLSKAGTDV